MSHRFSRTTSFESEFYKLSALSNQSYIFKTKKMSKELFSTSKNVNNKRQVFIKCLINNCGKIWT